jgi:hypothetical protein
MAAVCGKEPMVVVGKAGSVRARCTAWLGKAGARRSAWAAAPGRRCATGAWCTRALARRPAMAVRETASAAVSGWPASARFSTDSSSSFSVAKASQLRISPSSAVSAAS